MIILIFIWAIASNWFAYKKGFYFFPKESIPNPLFLSFKQLLCAFGLYLVLQYLGLFLLIHFILHGLHHYDPTITSLSIPIITGIQFILMSMVLCSLLFYFYLQDRTLFYNLWNPRNQTSPIPKGIQFAIGSLTWFISFPIVTIVNDLTDTFMKAFFSLKTYEQAAVKYVKAAMSSPFSFVFALISVLIFAPIIEEFLFRGVLQTFLKKRLGNKAAILLSALCFAFFHFSFSQGLGNVSLIISLFILGGYLGFLYERQGSLWAPIGLHMTFNSISALRIIFFPEML